MTNQMITFLGVFILLISALLAYLIKTHVKDVAEKRRLAMFPERNRNSVSQLNMQGDIIYANPSSNTLLKKCELDSTDIMLLFPDDIKQKLKELYESGMESIRIEYSNGPCFLKCDVQFLKDMSVFNLYIEDITERKKIEDEMLHLATHDALTGLYNRHMLAQRLDDEIERALRYKHTMSVFMVDIDYFKIVNDTYGHPVGDTILCNFAKALEDSIRNTDYAARYGGEEFVVILPETTLSKAENLAKRLCNQIADYPFPVKGNKDFKLTISIGIATFPEHAQSSQELIEVSDASMYAAKNAGRNQVKTP